MEEQLVPYLLCSHLKRITSVEKATASSVQEQSKTFENMTFFLKSLTHWVIVSQKQVNGKVASLLLYLTLPCLASLILILKILSSLTFLIFYFIFLIKYLFTFIHVYFGLYPALS